MCNSLDWIKETRTWFEYFWIKRSQRKKLTIQAVRLTWFLQTEEASAQTDPPKDSPSHLLRLSRSLNDRRLIRRLRAIANPPTAFEWRKISLSTDLERERRLPAVTLVPLSPKEDRFLDRLLDPGDEIVSAGVWVHGDRKAKKWGFLRLDGGERVVCKAYVVRG